MRSPGLPSVVSTFLLALLMLAVPSAARAQSALQFNGTDDYVEFGTGLPSLGVANFTVETWFKRLGTGTTTSTGTNGVAALVPLVAKGAAQAEDSNVDANYILGINTAPRATSLPPTSKRTGAARAGRGRVRRPLSVRDASAW